MKRSDFFLGIILVLFALMMWFYLIAEGVPVPKGIENFYQAPDFWVRVITVGIFISGILLVNSGYKTIHKASDSVKPNMLRKYLKLGIGVFTFVMFYAFLEFFGIIICSTISVIVMALLYGERRFQYVLPISILLPVGLYFFFLKVASIPMPIGILDGVGLF